MGNTGYRFRLTLQVTYGFMLLLLAGCTAPLPKTASLPILANDELCWVMGLHNKNGALPFHNIEEITTILELDRSHCQDIMHLAQESPTNDPVILSGPPLN